MFHGIYDQSYERWVSLKIVGIAWYFIINNPGISPLTPLELEGSKVATWWYFILETLPEKWCISSKPLIYHIFTQNNFQESQESNSWFTSLMWWTGSKFHLNQFFNPQFTVPFKWSCLLNTPNMSFLFTERPHVWCTSHVSMDGLWHGLKSQDLIITWI